MRYMRLLEEQISWVWIYDSLRLVKVLVNDRLLGSMGQVLQYGLLARVQKGWYEGAGDG